MENYFIESERIGFSKWDYKDITLAKKLWGDEKVAKYISAKGYFTDEEIQSRLEKEISNEKQLGIQYWPMYLKETGEFIGCCGLRPYHLEKNIYETGYYLLPQFWGRGLATEALKRVIDYAFNYLKVSNIFSGHNPNNIASKKVLEKVGFNFIRNEYYEGTGLMHPSYLYKKEDK